MTKLRAPSHEWLLNEAAAPWADTGESLYVPYATKNGTIVDKPGIFGSGKVDNGSSSDYIEFKYDLTEYNPLGTEFSLRILAQLDKVSPGGYTPIWAWRRTNSPYTWAFGFYVSANTGYLSMFVGIGSTNYGVKSAYPIYLGTGLHDIVLVRKGAILRGYIDGCHFATRDDLPATTDVNIPGNNSGSRLFSIPTWSSDYMDNGLVDFVQYYDYVLSHEEIMALYDDPTPIITATSPGLGADANTEFYFDVISMAKGIGIDYSTCTVYVTVNGNEQLAYNGIIDEFVGNYNGNNSLRSAITDGFRFNFDPIISLGPSKEIYVRITIADNRGVWLENYTWSFTTAARLARYTQELGTDFAQSNQHLWRMDLPSLGTIYDACQKYKIDLTEINTSVISVSDSDLDFKHARRLNGSNAYITAPYTSTLNESNTTFMIRFLIRVQSILTGKHVIACRSSRWGFDPLNQGWVLWLENTERGISICWGGGRPYTNQYHTAKSAINDAILDYLPLGKWVELCAWFRPGSDTTYQKTQGPYITINGNHVPMYLVVGEKWTYWAATDKNTPAFYIGGTPSGDYLEADIAEIKYVGGLNYIPQSNLSKHQIFENALQTRLANKPSIVPSTEALWLFDNDTNPGQSGSTVKDEAGNHDGTVEGGDFGIYISPYRNPNSSADYDIGLTKNAEDARLIRVPHHANLNDLTNGLTIEMAFYPFSTSTNDAYIIDKEGTLNRGLKITVGNFVPAIEFTLIDNNDQILTASYDLRKMSTNYDNVPRLMAFIYDPATKTIYIYDGDTVYPNGGEATNTNFNHNNFGVTDDLLLFGNGVAGSSFKGAIYFLHWERRVKPLNEIFNDVKGTIF